MGTTYNFDKPHRLDKLQDELLAALPALAAVPGSDGYNHAVFGLWDDGDKIFIDVNDGVDVTRQQLQAVVDDHTPTARPPSQQEQDFAAARALLTGPGTLTNAQIKAILKLFGKQLAVLSRDD